MAPQELVQLHTSSQHRLATLDIKDFYVNLPTQDILEITKFWLHMNQNPQTMIEQVSALTKTVLN
jgi:NADPH-dependent 7-cyano-7-deazaguanine reductase QueF-like protein